jgi:hypothetical protein
MCHLGSNFILFTAMTFVFMLVVLVFPIVFLLGMTPTINQIIASLSFAFGNIVSVGLLFGPKALIVLSGEDLQFDGKKPKGVGSQIAPGAQAYEATAASTSESSDPIFANTKEAFKGKNLDERSQICRAQIEQWRALLLQIEARESSNTKGSSTNKVSHIAASEALPDLEKDEIPL